MVLFTLFGPRAGVVRLEFSEPLEDPARKETCLDRLGSITALAVLLILIAYAILIRQDLQMPRFGSVGFSPF